MQDVSSLSVTGISYRVWLKAAQVVALALLIGVLIFVLSRNVGSLDPYVQAVLQQQGQVDRGASLFALNCAACHGEEGDGKVGPSLRGVRERRSGRFLIEQVTSGNTPPMPQFQPDPQEMADLISYLRTL